MIASQELELERCGFCGRPALLVDDTGLCIRCDLMQFPPYTDTWRT